LNLIVKDFEPDIGFVGQVIQASVFFGPAAAASPVGLAFTEKTIDGLHKNMVIGDDIFIWILSGPLPKLK
jgi:hypothetical protein